MLDIVGKNIIVTRGNYMPITVSTKDPVNGTEYEFKINDIILFKVFERGNVDNVVLTKELKITESSVEATIEVTSDEMKLGDLINKPKDYWYEIELNPDTPKTQTIVGYDKESGPAILTLLPEGGDSK